MNRRGSALLIVLGMLAFMVISAVAFSAYMRHSRLPSSYLRRTSSSRHLVKAALAEAIDLIDASIGNDAYPGMGTAGRAYRYPRKEGDVRQRNFWSDRCFVGTNQCVSTEDTVATLNFEGLAYLPPALINDARYWSRRTTSAMWRTFGFDAGRYAFSAYDVTDCLDVNKLMADMGRDSSDYGRITLNYALEDTSHTGYLVQPSAWDSFMEKFRDVDGLPVDGKVPLTSLADFNLASFNEGLIPGGTPFCRAFGQKNVKFLNDETGSDAALQRGLSIVTDTWFPQTNRATGVTIDIANGKHQPFFGFSNDTENKNDVTFDQLAQQTSTFLTHFQNEIGMPEAVQLYDYLDRDGVPTSLAMPTTERTPMITGVSLEQPLQVSVVVGGPPSPIPATISGGQYQYIVKTYTIKVDGDPVVMAGAVFPFKYVRGSQRSFKAQACVSLAFVKGDFDNCRPNSATWAGAPSWTGGSVKTAQAGVFSGANNKPSGFWIRSAEKQLILPTSISVEQDAVLTDVSLELGHISQTIASEVEVTLPGVSAPYKVACSFLHVTREKWGTTLATPAWVADTSFTPIAQFGAVPANDALGASVTPASGDVFAPAVQAWVRITDPNAASGYQTVDQAPACVADDRTPSSLLADARGSALRPAFRFSSGTAPGVEYTGTELKLSGSGTFEASPKAYVADDPRFNYAPENFWALGSIGSDFKTEWFQRQRSADRDGDIFMSTSDAGYLQSPFELSFLLRITGLTGNDDWGCMTGDAYDGKARSPGQALAAENGMWRTYSQYDCGGFRDGIAALDIRTGSRGFRMTPYAASTDAMMAVFANTPLDWWAASTNDLADANGTAKQTMLDSLTESLKYTFSEHAGAQVQVRWNDLRTLCDNVRGLFRGTANAQRPWTTVWDDADWDGGNLTSILGCDLRVNLHSVDRKFLHGYWRECFANRQQLFLVFVRAEPMMMGGGGLGQTPPQLGARAVALVWRDPNPTREDLDGDPRPHRTRILFYRQLD